MKYHKIQENIAPFDVGLTVVKDFINKEFPYVAHLEAFLGN